MFHHQPSPNIFGGFSAHENSAANTASRIFFGGFTADKNSVANMANCAGLGVYFCLFMIIVSLMKYAFDGAVGLLCIYT